MSKIKIVCRTCGFESVFVTLPRHALCAKCGVYIIRPKGTEVNKSMH